MKKSLRITLIALAVAILGVGAYMVYCLGPTAPHLRNGNHTPNVATNANSLQYFTDNTPRPMAPVAKKGTSNNLNTTSGQKATNSASTKTNNNSSNQATPHAQTQEPSKQPVEQSIPQLNKTVEHLTTDVLALLSL